MYAGVPTVMPTCVNIQTGSQRCRDHGFANAEVRDHRVALVQMLVIVCEIDSGHPAGAELAVESIMIGERVDQRLGSRHAAHGTRRLGARSRETTMVSRDLTPSPERPL
jgi:hypothetical protein